MSFTPPTPMMHPISLSPTHVNNPHVPSPPISSIPSTFPTPSQPQPHYLGYQTHTQFRPLHKHTHTHTHTQTDTLTPTCNINIQAMPLPPPQLRGMRGPAGGENKKRRSIPKQEMHQQGPIRGLYQASGSPVENLGGAACWLADQSGSCVITGQEVRGNQERLRACARACVCVCVRLLVCTCVSVCELPWLSK